MGLSRLSRALAAFQTACLLHPTSFVRNRLFTASSTMLALMCLCAVRKAGSYAELLRRMQREFGDSLDWSNPPSAGAFSKARGKVPASTCRKIWEDVLKSVRPLFAKDSLRLVFGMRALAFDGTSMMVPHDMSTKKRWPCPKIGDHRRAHHPQALLVIAFELFSRLPVGVAVMGKVASEHLGLRQLLRSIGKNQLLIVDRGYVGKVLLREMIESGNQVVLRMTSAEANCWDAVYAFMRSKAREQVITLLLPAKPKSNDLPMEVRVRLIRRSFRRGRPGRGQKRDMMVILTTLTDSIKAPRQEIIDLYTARWGIETFNRELKLTFNLEAFHSSKADRIEQELYAALCWMTIAATVESSADRLIRLRHGPQRWNDQTRIQVRRTLLFTIVDDWFGKVMVGDIAPGELDGAMADDIAYLVRYAAKRRPHRSYPRKRLRPYGRFRAK
jgi:hypothetical protein